MRSDGDARPRFVALQMQMMRRRTRVSIGILCRSRIAGNGIRAACVTTAALLWAGMTPCAGDTRAAEAESPAPADRSLGRGPVVDADLVLWLDAQDLDGTGSGAARAGSGEAVARWADKSGRRHDAVQAAPAERPTRVAEVFDGGLAAVHFSAASRQSLLVAHSPAFDVPTLTAFVVARAAPSDGDMWLFSTNDWGPPWTGYGIAVSGAGLRPWLHLGVEGGGRGYFQFGGSLSTEFRVVEISYDGRKAQGVLDARLAEEQALAGGILANGWALSLGTLGTQFLEGDIAEILLYRRALEAGERERTRRYLLEKYAIPARGPDASESALVTDWLFQAEGRPLAERAREEIRWAQELAARLSVNPRAADLSAHVAELDALARKAAGTRGGKAARELYLAVRKVKRALMFANPAVDFTQIVCIDQPLPQGSESSHEAVHRLGLMAVPGGRLLLADARDPAAPARQLAPEKPGSFWRPDLSFDAARVLFCYKAHDEKSFHLYEMNLDGGGLRQLTDSAYDDIDPIYLPDGRIMFTTTRGNTYVRCGPYIYSYVLARCDADGRNVYLVSLNSEPDFVPALLGDGRVVYSRWEYSDKDQNRVQSLWTTRQDGTQTSVLWGNQSVWPDHPAEPRALPGSGRIMFTAVGHHDWFHGSIGIVDPNLGANFPRGLTRVTFDLPWAEVGNSPADRPEASDYHSSGRFSGYLGAYPLSEEELLVSARGEEDKFRIYLMDVHGNRELVFEGQHHAWYALPVRPRTVPPRQADLVAWPAGGKERGPAAAGVFFNPDVYEGVPELPRGTVKFLRVWQQDAKTYSTWHKIFAYSGPAVSAVQSEAVKRIVSTVPVEPDGSVCFEAPPGRALFFQLLDKEQRAVHTMRSFTGVLPGEHRGCTGCHALGNAAPPNRAALAFRRAPTAVTPPPWGTESIGYERFVQPVLDRRCGACHQGEGEARKTLDLTLRPAGGEFALFKEPYLTLVGGAAWPVQVPGAGRPGYGIAGAIPVYGLRPDDVYPNDAATDGPSTIHRTLRPLRYLSARSPLIELALRGEHHGVKLEAEELLRLIAWVDANCPFLGEEEIRVLPDPVFDGIETLPIRPRLQSAPVVERP